jgi:N4-(beta-N-acetylglucosaminyl)-L-asparaginase
MNTEQTQRRRFLQGATFAGLSAPLLTAESAAAEPLRSALGQARPIVISSSNINKAADGSVFNSGIECVTKAMSVLQAGGDTLDAAVQGVNVVEDDPRDDSVGYGGLPNEDGEVELDSCVMHGPTNRAGAVASLKYIKNPSRVAKLILERTDHILLVGEGALRFAVKQGFKKEELLTESARLAWLKWREGLNPTDAWGPSPLKTPGDLKKVSQAHFTREQIALNEYIADRVAHRRTGTINCLALNVAGDLSGVTTTSGMAWKIPGRVGDSPLIGCGLYVDNEVGASGSTGRGEECIYINGSHTVVEMMRQGKSPTEACLEALKRISARYGNNKDELKKFDINFYALNKKGEYGSASLWQGGRVAVHDGKEAKIIDAAYLYERKDERKDERKA